MKFKKRVALTQDLKYLLDGLILGDGTLAKVSTTRFTMSQSTIHKDWLLSIKTQLIKFGIESVIYDKVYSKPTKAGWKRNPMSHMYSHSYLDLNEEKNRWYPEKKKIIPKDINLSSPITLANWHMGDGNLYFNKGRMEIGLHTNSFTDSDVEILISKFETQLGIHATIKHWRQQPVISITHRNAEKFVNIIRPHMVESFQYKALPSVWEPPRCIICNKIIEGEEETQKYTKYCFEHKNSYLKRLKLMSREEKDEKNQKIRECRLRKKLKIGISIQDSCI